MPTWIDDFLFWDFIAVAILGFVDWIIGKRRRESIKESLAHFWIRIDDLSYKKLAVEKAIGLNKKLEIIFGKSLFSWKRILVSSSLSLIMAGVIYSLIISREIYDESFIFYGPLIYLLINAVLDWVCLSANIFFLSQIAIRKSTFSIIFPLIGLISLALMFFPMVIFLSWMFSALMSSVLHAFEFQFIVWVIFIKIIPLGYYFLYLTILFLIKIGRFVLEKPFNTMILRLYETKQGVLTQIALAGGIIAKLLQEYIKYIA